MRALVGFLFPHRWKSDLAVVKRLLASEHPAPEGLGVRLDRWLDSVGWEVRNATLKLVVHIEDEARYPRLVEKLSDRSEAGIVRRNAAELLGRVGLATPGARPALLGGLADRYWEVRAESGRALAKLFAPAADLEDALLGRLFAEGRNGRKRLREHNFEVRMAVAQGLGNLGLSESALEALTELARDASWLVRSQAAVGITQLAARMPAFHDAAREVVRRLDRQSEGAVSYFIHREVLSRALRLLRRGSGQVPPENLRPLYLNPKIGWNHVGG